MMGVKFFFCSAYLAGMVIAGQNVSAPMAIFPRSAATACSFILFFALCNIPALGRAIGVVKMPIFGRELFSAILAGKYLSNSISAGINRLTTFGAGNFIKHNPAGKFFPTNNTNPIMAIWAIVTAGIMNYKQLATAFTIALKCEGLVFEHISIIPYFTHIQRWVDMTGKEPVLLEAA